MRDGKEASGCQGGGCIGVDPDWVSLTRDRALADVAMRETPGDTVVESLESRENPWIRDPSLGAVEEHGLACGFIEKACHMGGHGDG